MDAEGVYGPIPYQNLSNVYMQTNATQKPSNELPAELGWLLTMLCVLGVFCNALTIIVLRIRNTLGTRLLLYLSYVDVTIIPLVYIQTVLRQALPVGTQKGIYFSCLTPFFRPLSQTVYTLEVYLTVLIAIHRTAVLAVRLKFIHFTRDSDFNKCLIGIAVFALVFNIPEWIRDAPELYWNSDLNMTLVRKTENSVISYSVYQLFKLIVDTVLPVVTILTCDGIIVVSRFRSVPIGQERRARGRNQLTNIVVAITTVSVLLGVTQACIYAILKLSGHVTRVIKMYLFVVLTAIIFTNSTVNIFFYCLFGPEFRKTLVSLFRRNANSDDEGKLFEKSALKTQSAQPKMSADKK